MRFEIIPVTPFEQNCSLVWCEATGSAALVDPGGDTDVLLAAVERAGVTLEKLLLTHAHIDHVAGTPTLARTLGLPIYGPPGRGRLLAGRASGTGSHVRLPSRRCLPP
jgi:hydroxyacylglutathione hydrolase